MKRLLERLTHYEKREHDLLILSCVPLVCMLIACGLSFLLGEPVPLEALGGACLLFVIVVYAHSRRHATDRAR